MVCEEEKVYQFFPKFKKQFGNYEDPMSRPRITLIGELKLQKIYIIKKDFSHATLQQIYTLISMI